MGYNAIEIDGEVKLDLSEDTVTEETLPEGVTAHDANGEPIQGKMKFVKSINGKTGDVTLNASDVGAEDAGTVSTHNTNTDAHNDIRLELTRLSGIINDVLDSEDIDLNELHEIVAYIKSNSALIAAITVSKVNVADIINNLTTNVTDKPLSAAQGVVLNGLIDALGKDKLDASKLTEAINTALAEAKASGKFDGEDGNPGRGIDSVEINDDGELVITYSDSNTETAGKVKGEDGVLTPDQEDLLKTLKEWYDEEHYVTMVASISPSNSTYELGEKVTITFEWSFKLGTGQNAPSAKLSYLKVVDTEYQDDENDEDEIPSSGEITIENIDSTRKFYLNGTRKDGNKEPATATAYVYFYNKYYFGCAPAPTIPNNATEEEKNAIYSEFIKGTNGYAGLKTSSGWISQHKAFTITPNCPEGSYIWYAYPTRYGTSTFKMNGLPADFNVQVVSFTNNTEKHTEDYYLYQSIEHSLGSIEVQII